VVRQSWGKGTFVGLEFRHIEQVKHLIPGKTMYVVSVQAKADSWKLNKAYVIILRISRIGARPVLIYKGGGGHTVPTYEIVDIHDGVPNPDMPGTWLPKHAVQITDPASGNSQTMGRILLFRHNQEFDVFESIFDEVISHTASPPISSVLGYVSKLEFRANQRTELQPSLKDIVVKTHIVNTEGDVSSRGDREYSIENLFRWDGKTYIGELALPESVSGHQAYSMRLKLHQEPPLFEVRYKERTGQ
jgi:hypothetical protein